MLAAAVRGRADVIVTYNLKDFPFQSLQAYGIVAMSPSEFLRGLYDADAERILLSLDRQAAAIRQPLVYLLDRLTVNVPGFV